MSNTTTNKKNTTTKAKANYETPVAKPKTKPSRIDDSVLVKVKSNCYGTLIYRNLRTNDTTIWNGCGDIQIMSMGDLRAMKSEQVGFFKNHWIVICGVADGSDCEATCEDIYNALIVSQYYQNFIDPRDFAEISNWNEKEIQERIGMLSPGAKENFIVAINTFIENGQLDSIKKIKMFEKALGCSLYGNN